jgi:hypothetical protein
VYSASRSSAMLNKSYRLRLPEKRGRVPRERAKQTWNSALHRGIRTLRRIRTLACPTLAMLGKYTFPLPYVIARKARGPLVTQAASSTSSPCLPLRSTGFGHWALLTMNSTPV